MPLRHTTDRVTPMVVAAMIVVVVGSCSGEPDNESTDGRPSPSTSTTTSHVATVEDLAAGMRDQAEPFVDAGQPPGVIALVRVGDQTRVVTEGVARQQPRRRMAHGLRFPIGSVTKSMVAALVMSLVEQQVLQLGDPVSEWLPGLLDGPGADVTVQQLLSHRSGIPEHLDAPGAERLLSGDCAPPEAFVRLVADDPLTAQPGTATSYSNTNFFILGMMVEAATGRSLEENLSRAIFEPAGMSSTSLPDRGGPEPRLVHGYTDDGDVTDVTQVWCAWAAGGVISTATDVDRFYAALLDGHLVSEAGLRRLVTVTGSISGSDYGLGVAVQTTECGVAYGHNGRLPGYFTDAWTLADSDRAVVVMVNFGEDPAQTGPIGSIVSTALCD